MKKIYAALLAVSCAAAGIALTANSAFAQAQPADHATLAAQISNDVAIVTQLNRIEAQRRTALATVSTDLTSIGSEAAQLSKEPLETQAERADVSARIDMIKTQLSGMSTIVADLNDLRNGEINLLTFLKNGLLDIEMHLSA